MRRAHLKEEKGARHSAPRHKERARKVAVAHACRLVQNTGVFYTLQISASFYQFGVIFSYILGTISFVALSLSS